VLSIGFELLAGGEEDASCAVDANVLLQFGGQDRERLEKAPIDGVIGDGLADFIKEGFADLSLDDLQFSPSALKGRNSCSPTP